MYSSVGWLVLGNTSYGINETGVSLVRGRELI